MNSADDLWSVLAEEAGSNQGFIARRLADVSGCDAFLALRQPDGVRALLLEVPSSAIASSLRFPECTGFGAHLVPLSAGASGRTQVVLHARNADPHGLFTALVQDVLEHVREGKSPRECLQQMEARLHRWSRFFAGGNTDGLSLKRQQGLWAELWCLRELIDHGVDRASLVAAWMGPSAANHDFEFPGISLEVKSTTSGPPSAVRITNALQLQAIADTAIMLLALLLDATPDNGLSLSGMVTSIRERLADAGAATRMFEDKLLDAGYVEALSQHYPIMRFSLREASVFEVRQGFPRLVESDIPAGVGDVRYSVSLDACQAYRISVPEMQTRIGELVGAS